MKTKTKKLTYLTAGLTGALAASAVAGVALSACTVTTSNSGSSDITLPDTWYNKDINWQDSTSLNNLLIDSQGIVYSNKYMTEIIAILPGYGGGTITIPASVKTISGYYNVVTSTSGTTRTATGAFEGLTTLTNVVFAGKNITQIGARAFYGCTSLQSITLPTSVTLVGDQAFQNCTSLNTINLNNLQYIGANAFNSAFTNIPYGSLDLNLAKVSFVGASAFSGATGINTVDFSKNSTLTTVSESAFSGCTYLKGTIDFTSDKLLVTIGDSAFANCPNITNVYLTDTSSLKTIGASAFSGCTSLVSIGTSGTTTGFIVPSTVTSIGATAFANTLIAKIDLSQNLATNPLKASALKNMPELADIDLGTKITTLNEDLFENTPKLSDFDLVLPASITSIAQGNGTSVGNSDYTPSSYATFYKSGFKSIDLSKIAGTLTYIGYGFFEGSTNLEKVVLKSTTTRILFRGFYGCTGLKTVVFADAEGNVDSTTTGFVAPSTLTSIGSYAFYNTGLETVNLSAVTSNILGTGTTSAGTAANTYRFANSTSLATVNLPTTTTFIPEYNFYGCTALSSVNFANLTNLTGIGSNNFSGTAFTDIDLSNTKLTALSDTTIFNSMTTEATVKLPATLLSVGSNTFTWLKPNTEGTGTTQTALPLQYPNGWATSSTSYQSKILAASTSSFLFLSRVSGALDFSNFTNMNGIGWNTVFGDTALTSLTFAAKSFAAGVFNTNDNSAAKWTYLGFIGTGISANTDTTQNPSTYVTSKLPFGSMSGLTNINFNNFTAATIADGVTATNPLEKTTADTWSEVTRIINSFAKSAPTTTEGQDPEYVANLSDWGDTSSDVTSSVTINEEEGKTGLVSSVQLSTTGGESLATIDTTTTEAQSFTYGGVTWTITIDSTAGTVTLTSSADVDTYRATLDGTYSSTYKVFFNTQTSTREVTGDDGSTTTQNVIVPNSTITVTLNVVPASTNS